MQVRADNEDATHEVGQMRSSLAGEAELRRERDEALLDANFRLKQIKDMARAMEGMQADFEEIVRAGHAQEEQLEIY